MFEKPRQLIEGRFYISPKGFRMIFLVSVLMMLAALAIVWPNVRKVKLSYDYQTLAAEREELLSENHLLRLERESLQSLYRIQELAKNEVGMIEPEKGQITTIFLK
ncbi:MAG: cell division protein FtsL [Nitrospinae bacterium]|nr:cell division protein FtsL [Nitrospinota bacterium]MZH05078.1 cell division protein FtsL [Nitrospinota bacterium]MZH14949.1 cell division protein FtsL [Nitrospinota bacterium]